MAGSGRHATKRTGSPSRTRHIVLLTLAGAGIVVVAGAIVALALTVRDGTTGGSAGRHSVRDGASVTGVQSSPPTTTSHPLPLAGKVVGIDPGHNGDNWSAPSVINAPVFNGRTTEPCDTTGTETDSGYTEAQFNFDVAEYLATDLRAEGAQVVLTRDSNAGVGPCVTERAALINAAHPDAAVDIHADGGPPAGRGFAVLEPVADGPNDAIIASSSTLAADVRDAFAAGTVMPVSTYDGTDGLEPRDDLAGLNFATEPKVLIECGNMRNATDAALLVTPAFQQAAAQALTRGLTDFLTHQ